MKKRWDILYKKLESYAIHKNSYQFFDFYIEIKKNYKSSTRHYHTLDHVEYMLDNLDKYFTNLITEEEKLKLELAIWYHDIIYIVQSEPSINEYESTLIFSEMAQYIGLSEEFIKDVYDLIMITTHTIKPETLSQKIICDLDLLGMGTGDYFKNGDAFRLEFYHLTNEEWNEGRIDFLEYMLNKKPLFHTGMINKYYEANAHYNLTKELSLIKNEIIHATMS